MSDEFKVHRLTERGLRIAADVAAVFDGALRELDALGVLPGRQRALIVTKLQEACFFAKLDIAMQNQTTEEG